MICFPLRDRVNPMLFQYSYSVAIQHRRDTNNVRIPPIAETFPANFVEPSAFQDAREEATLITDPGSRVSLTLVQKYSSHNFMTIVSFRHALRFHAITLPRFVKTNNVWHISEKI